ncbi:hypothetical protein A3D78_07780 [Candidatus Gottesmanbacteria bacterium RIFCSPHIGHO2_02_FULL_39_14]|uniref:Shikimate dehydrogenase (NADP(+)) n=2 Tax=Candidatus Gottesmaniibacteriota TaxID=1752720 RepID=A0A1F6A2T2_9BACT|nr:MAG: hypothetical protein A3D78_07780 [Candidatus Gottesmanbacteria bacterium RIFCSPHIGHO2_02_FULL_39_14]OGG31061.1 MAG: hypothetical protein A3I51_04250 [Candidatus Gottesmanbacteria bacterium RIFCSPLOWO2_02_FULL_38_8]
MNINGQTKIIGFFGQTYKTSIMYALYNAAFKALNLNYVYVPFAVTDLKKAVDGIRHLGINAVGVTFPFKIEIIKYLDELDGNAKRIGAVNAVINRNGKLIGVNTDGQGAVLALKEKNVNLKNKKIIILGDGGASKSIAVAVSDEGGKISLLNRKNLSVLNKEIKKADIIINATTVGMYPEINKSLINKKLLFPDLSVMEIITQPKETKLVKDAHKVGCRIVYGERMLLWQAVLKFKLFTGIDAPVKIMEKALC